MFKIIFTAFFTALLCMSAQVQTGFRQFTFNARGSRPIHATLWYPT